MCRKNFILLPILLSICIQLNGTVAQDDDGRYDGLYDLVYVYLDHATTHVLSGFEYYLPIVKGLPDELTDLSNAVITVGNVHIQVTISDLTEKIDGLTQEAEDVGADLDVLESCIQTYNDDLSALSEDTKAKIEDCVDRIVTQGLVIVEESLNRTNGLPSLLTAKAFRIEECRVVELAKVQSCLITILTDIQQTGYDLYREIFGTLRDTTYAVRDVEQTLGVCTLDGIDAAEQKGAEIINSIRVCAKLPTK